MMKLRNFRLQIAAAPMLGNYLEPLTFLPNTYVKYQALKGLSWAHLNIILLYRKPTSLFRGVGFRGFRL